MENDVREKLQELAEKMSWEEFEACMQDLITKGLVEERVVDGEARWFITELGLRTWEAEDARRRGIIQ